MSEYLAQHAAKWFDELETWQSFVDLIPLKEAIEDVWIDQATEALRQHFRQNHCQGWNFCEWGHRRDTWWFLEEFGRESVGIGFGWKYHFCFGVAFGGRIDRDRVTQALQQETYRDLRRAFGRIDNTGWNNCALEQSGDFRFGSARDHRLPPHELAWYAGFQTSEFVRQAAAKVEAFVDPDITALLCKLNVELMTG
jgi:hypothetical protein